MSIRSSIAAFLKSQNAVTRAIILCIWVFSLIFIVVTGFYLVSKHAAYPIDVGIAIIILIPLNVFSLLFSVEQYVSMLREDEDEGIKTKQIDVC
jgi:hypothetical protein